MPYEPTNWQQGDDITVEKLNKIEQGIQNEQEGPQGEFRSFRRIIINYKGSPIWLSFLLTNKRGGVLKWLN